MYLCIQILFAVGPECREMPVRAVSIGETQYDCYDETIDDRGYDVPGMSGAEYTGASV